MAATFTLANCIRRYPAYTRTYSPTVVWSSLAVILMYSPRVFGTSSPLSSLWPLALFTTYVIHYSVSFVCKRYILCSQLQKLRHEKCENLRIPSSAKILNGTITVKYTYRENFRVYCIITIYIVRNFHKFCKKILFSLKNIIVNISGYSVIIFFDTFLIYIMKIQKFSPQTFQTIQYVHSLHSYVVYTRHLGGTIPRPYCAD